MPLGRMPGFTADKMPTAIRSTETLGRWISANPLAQTALAKTHLSAHDVEHKPSPGGPLVAAEDSTGRLNNLPVSPG
jgi:hypothetical protein